MERDATACEGARLVIRRPGRRDAAAIHALVSQCPPLELNSLYCYLLQCTDFAETCGVAEVDGSIEGFVSGYLKPVDTSVLFVWQICVGAGTRGQGIGLRLIKDILNRTACRSVQFVEATVTPSNIASEKLFHALARDFATFVSDGTGFACEEFGSWRHEAENRIRVGPFAVNQPER